MKKISLLILFLVANYSINAVAKTGDTTHVPVLDKYLWVYNGSVDNWAQFPTAGKHYEKILLRYKLTCPNPSCGQWDYTTKVILKHHTGVIDSVLQDAPNFTVNGNAVDSFAFKHDTTRTYSYNKTKKTTDSTANGATKIYFYKNPAKPFLATDSLYVWQANYWNYIYDNTGKVKDSLYVKADSVFHVTKIKAYFLFEVIVPYEIGRLITPYGQGFPKDWNFTWTMDVTDYAFLLHDSCEFLSTYDGYSQGSLYSFSFDLIEGTPPRETYRIDILYDGYFPYGNASDPITNYIKPKKLWMDPNVGVLTYRTFTTGHGAAGPDVAAEFTDKTHSIWVDGVHKYDQHLWRDDCGHNAVYPQTGTWTLSRGGWCPGDKVDPWDFDLTGMGKSGDSILVDYRFEDYTCPPGAGYAIQTQAIYSKGPQFNNDVALLTVLAPTNDPPYRRSNPICSGMSPMVTIRNNGKNDLTSLTFKYGIDGTTDHTYQWTPKDGKLKYYDTSTFALPGIDLGTGSHIFNILLDAPNGTADEYPNNNTGAIAYTMPKIYSNNVYLALKTDNLDGEANGIRYEVVDANENVLYSQSDMPDGAITRDTFKLATGCYRFRIFDESSFPEGLYPWELQSQDPKVTFGNFTLKDDKKATIWNAQVSNNLASFGPEEIVPFMVQAPSSVSGNPSQIPSLVDFSIYPNPAHGKISLDLTNLGDYGGGLRVSVFSILGKEIITRTVYSADGSHVDLDMKNYPAGSYTIRLQYGDVKVTKKCILN